jgi:hypothetical protein
MAKVNEGRSQADCVRPCQIFDVIGGTSTGGSGSPSQLMREATNVVDLSPSCLVDWVWM